MVVHIPSGGGKPLLMSIPRDSYVPIPGYGSNKINAAFAFGGPRLLAETVQNLTGLRSITSWKSGSADSSMSSTRSVASGLPEGPAR